MLDMSPLTVEFTDCSHGWITFQLSAAQSHIIVHATYQDNCYMKAPQYGALHKEDMSV